MYVPAETLGAPQSLRIRHQLTRDQGTSNSFQQDMYIYPTQERKSHPNQSMHEVFRIETPRRSVLSETDMGNGKVQRV